MLVEAWNALGRNEACGRGPARYEAENDRFELLLEGEVDTFGAEPHGDIKLYPIRAYGWCWEECGE
jgi:hypothetical protein